MCSFPIIPAAGRPRWRHWQPDLIVSGGFPWRIPAEVLDAARYGGINTHDALLPRHRGPNATGWAFRLDDRETGVTIHRLSPEFDTGAILAQHRVPIEDHDTWETLLPQFVQALPSLLGQAIDRIARGDPGDPQDEALATEAGLFPPDWRPIDWSQPARSIHNQVRSWVGLRDIPAGALGELDGQMMQIVRTRLLPPSANGAGAEMPGTILARSPDHLVVQCGDGPLEILEWHPVNGYIVSDSAMEESLPTKQNDAFSADERRVLAALCVGAFIGLLTFVAPAPFLPAMAVELDVTVPLLGQVVAAMLLISAVLGLVAGPIADRYGPRRVILAGQAAAIVCFLLFGVAPGMPVLVLAAVAGGCGNAAVLGPSLALAGVTFSGGKTRSALAWVTAAMAGTAIVGVPLLSAIGSFAGWRGAFLLAAVATAGVWVMAFAWLPPHQPRARVGDSWFALFAAYRPLLRHTVTLRLYAIAVLRAICWFGMLTYFGAFLTQQLGFSTAQVGLAYMLGGSGYFLGSLAAGGPLSFLTPRTLLIAGNLVMAVAMGVAFSGRLGAIGTVGLMPFATFAGAFGWIAVVALLTAVSPAGPGTTLTLHGSLFNLGAAGGGALGGLLLAAQYGPAAGLPAFGLLAALLAWWPVASSDR